jgi:hypothetical protein
MRIDLGYFVLFTAPSPDVEPGHQLIGAYPINNEARCMLKALTGAIYLDSVTLDDRYCLVAPHDQVADDRLVLLVDLCAAIRRDAPDLVQLRIEDLEGIEL